jgi:hypothetical protein
MAWGMDGDEWMGCVMGNCKDCKHWKTIYVSEPVPVEKGQCAAMVDSAISHNMAYVADHDGEGFLVTRFDFGCVLFEAKEIDPR